MIDLVTCHSCGRPLPGARLRALSYLFCNHPCLNAWLRVHRPLYRAAAVWENIKC